MGGDGADRLLGGNGDDTLTGGAAGDTGINRMFGGQGSDAFFVTSANDRVADELNGAGIDKVFSDISFVLAANIEQLFLNETSTDINATGNGLSNRISGNANANRIEGGAAADSLTGGAGNDVFLYKQAAHSGASAGTRDTITDFTVDPANTAGFVDRINLFAIDAKAGTAGNNAFTFIGGATFTAEGQIRVVQVLADTVVSINISGVTGADMTILLANVTAANLTSADFIL